MTCFVGAIRWFARIPSRGWTVVCLSRHVCLLPPFCTLPSCFPFPLSFLVTPLSRTDSYHLRLLLMDSQKCHGGIEDVRGAQACEAGAVPNIVHPLRFFSSVQVSPQYNDCIFLRSFELRAYITFICALTCSLCSVTLLHPVWLRPLFVPLVFGYWYVSWSACHKSTRTNGATELTTAMIIRGVSSLYSQRETGTSEGHRDRRLNTQPLSHLRNMQPQQRHWCKTQRSCLRPDDRT